MLLWAFGINFISSVLDLGFGGFLTKRGLVDFQLTLQMVGQKGDWEEIKRIIGHSNGWSHM